MGYTRTTRLSNITELKLTGSLAVDTINEKTAGAGVTIDGAKLKDSLVEANLKDGVTIGGDAVTKIKVGTYVGDGSVSLAITGVGFQVKYVIIWSYTESTLASESIHEKATGFYTNMNAFHSGAGGHGIGDDHIISLDADGFTVDDNANDEDPNSNGATYVYLALG